MSVLVEIEHRTRYRFDRPVALGPHVLRLRPAQGGRTPILGYDLGIRPERHHLRWHQDVHGNPVARLVVPDPVRELDLTVHLVADLAPVNPFDFFVDDAALHHPFRYAAEQRGALAPCLRPVTEADGRPSAALDRWLAPLRRRPLAPAGADAGAARPRTVDLLVELCGRVHDTLGYSLRLEAGVLSPQTLLDRGIGSCRDFAWLTVAAARRLGLAARFVSGYLVQLAGPAPDAPDADGTDLHAWAEVYLPGAGWIGLDGTSGLLAAEGHIPLAAAPDPDGAAPVEGSHAPCRAELSHRNTVRRLGPAAPGTEPYTDEQWAEIDRTGRHVDELLRAGDVRLTMGGEPTFVAADARDAQWNTGADGPDKRRLAAGLAAGLRAAFAPAGIHHHGQGKWYPGEASPRWQTALVWRRDGRPLWHDQGLLADPHLPAGGEPEKDPTPADAEALGRAVARHLGIDPRRVVPAWEDPLAALAAEGRLPAGDLPPDRPELASAAGRAALTGELDARAGRPAGWVLPLHRRTEDAGWRTTVWAPRRAALFLLPGDAPLGARLPLDSLSWSWPDPEPERAAAEPRPPLGEPAASFPEALEVAADSAPPTALCVQRRPDDEGRPRLFVYLPPLPRVEHGLDLLAAVERAAHELGRPVVLEGYGLPWDPRLASLSVTPDPGVVEVNVQPGADWAELGRITIAVHEAARAVGLRAEKLRFDGGRVATGGGSHITLGGTTPADSPVLRRPDLLRSMLTFWQHHPALSYLFSGTFVGPTSQAPRVDEGRVENLYELEIAFAEFDRLGPLLRPWHVDRLLRHLLTDVTGNTHRSEFCIDKLYSPDSERGRLGLLELRGFEMAPHPRMQLVQSLLVRALVARFWAEPYTGRLVRWGTALADRFLLPDVLRADAAEVTADLRRHGIDVQDAWLEPFAAFRLPAIGRAEIAGPGGGAVVLELAQAIEPWHVLGEEATSGGTARFVDSSLDRVQLAATGLTPGRHVVTCNGVPVPLHEVGGRLVGGVRYKAWPLWNCLHPTLEAEESLVFDVVDLWTGASLGGARYTMRDPGGRTWTAPPVDDVEAGTRRAARFRPEGHSPVPLSRTALDRLRAVASPEFPYTLDLRRVPREVRAGHVPCPVPGRAAGSRYVPAGPPLPGVPRDPADGGVA